MAFDAEGRLHLAYFDSAKQSLVYSVRGINGAWSAPEVIDGMMDAGQNISLAIDPSGHAGIAYYDAADKNLKYAHAETAGWTSTVVDPNRGTGYYASLTYRTSGQPLIGYYAKSGGDLRLARNTRGGWKSQPIDTGMDVGRGVELAVDPQTNLWSAAYLRRNDGALIVAREKVLGYSRAVIDRSPKGFAFLSLAFDADKNPAVSYFDAAEKDLRFARSGADDAWETQTVASQGNVGQFSNVTFDSDGQAVLVYFDHSQNIIAMASNNGSGWESSTLVVGAGEGLVVSRFGDQPITLSYGEINSDAIEETIATLPAVPTSFNAEAISDSQISLTWIVAGQSPAGLIVERSADGVHFSTLAELDGSAHSYQDSSVTESASYSYRVRARSESVFSDPTPIVTVITPPAAPTGLAAAAVSPTRINLQWTNNAHAAAAFAIQRARVGGTFADLARVAADAMTYSDEDVAEGTSYIYRIRAVSDGIGSSYSASASATTEPSRPDALVALSVSDSRIDLGWTDQSQAETGYIIARSIDGALFNDIATLAANTSLYTDNNISESTSYTYRVRAIGVTGVSEVSNLANATTRPAAPTSLVATSIASGHIRLTWIDVSAGESAYVISRSTDQVHFSELAVIDADSQAFEDTGLVESTQYTYRVIATNGGGASAFSDDAATFTRPETPSVFAAEPVSDTQVALSWQDNSAGESRYVVERSTDGSVFSTLAMINANSTSFIDDTAAEASEYQYRVRAANGVGKSAASESATVFTLPAAPSGLSAAGVSDSRIDLFWTDNSSAESAVIVDRSTDNVHFSELLTLGASATEYHDTGLSPNTTYYYRVRVISQSGRSSTSDSVGATTQQQSPPESPANFSASAVSGSVIELTWVEKSKDATGFIIERAVDGKDFEYLISIDADGSKEYAWHDLKLETDTRYVYRIYAYNSGGNSDYTAKIDAQTWSSEPPGVPEKVSLKPLSGTQMNIYFYNRSDDISGVVIERSDDGKNFEQVADIAINQSAEFNYIDTGLKPGATYDYRLYSYRYDSRSEYSDVVQGTTGDSISEKEAPAAPVKLEAKASSPTSIYLSWIDESDLVRGFIIERSTNGETFQFAGHFEAEGQTYYSYEDTQVRDQVTYFYRVRAYNSVGNSDFSQTVQASID